MKTLYRIIVIGVFVLSAGSATAAPFGYSVNADQPNGDTLYVIDLANGATTLRGQVRSGTTDFLDVEGLAFDASGELWAVDESSLSLFPVNRVNGTVDLTRVEPLTGLGAVSGNDFGMTFTCDGSLYVSSVAEQALYQLSPTGSATLVGSLGVNISALAAQGNPTELYGLGNGLLADGVTQDSRSLYRIDPATGAATLIGPLGAEAADYFEAGISFDDSGRLWAITDRRDQAQELPSEIFEIDLATGTATKTAETVVQSGFESLAVAPPSNCQAVPPPAPRPLMPVPPIPTLDAWGRLAATLALVLAGFLALRQRP